ncbi:MAG: hypothetical protein IJV36_02030 [Prevotella sp.]|nr:hypothetical protein [Prevotella sp.]
MKEIFANFEINVYFCIDYLSKKQIRSNDETFKKFVYFADASDSNTGLGTDVHSRAC